ncbi:MAG: uracil phosphoribosyltransferase [Bacteroidales bacterium]|uniref:uracil phosphoribosyltransferase n=1 Tax=Porphyromonas sp. TaxID=1924944 RepID=UPI00297654EB|nr:uracil phosphoribosyltransferase [Porphyromonas sp.]MDD7438547.1 uracil phosphoribosyltransferase [Bacteroidales bacterium]MDY3067575.1 uracil phosphoribosyltransferase [Porphyromonas sp.]
MKVINLSEQNSILNRFVAELRDVNIQGDRMRFKRNIERIGEILAYEISKTFEYKATEVQTPMALSIDMLDQNQVVVATILRAGLPLHQGFVNYFDRAENCFVSAYRRYKDRLNFEVMIEYLSSPSIDGKTLIIVDPMLATGSSMELAYKAILTKGTPKELHIVSVISSQPAIEYLSNVMPGGCTLWTAVNDPEIDSHSYIIPGLGDAGDLAFGTKLDD